MAARTAGCIALLPTRNLTGSVHVWRKIRRPVLDIITHLNKLAALDGYSRGLDPTLDHQVPEAEDVDEEDDDFTALPPLPKMMPIDGRFDVEVPMLPTQLNVVSAAGMMEHQEASTSTLELQLPQEYVVRKSERIAEAQRKANEVNMIYSEANESRIALCRHLLYRSNWIDKDFALHITVRAALRERPEVVRPVMMAELQQMVDKGVWHGIKVSGLSITQRIAIIRSSMFLKDKYLASGVFDKFKARLVAGGDPKTMDYIRIYPHQLLLHHRRRNHNRYFGRVS
jgi:DNA primase